MLKNYRLLKVCASRRHILNFCRNKSTRVDGAVFLEKGHEGPIIELLPEEVDLIGPPDPISNLRPIIRRRFVSETKLQEELRQKQDATHQWNQKFWSIHNTKFIKEKQKFIDDQQKAGQEKHQLTAEEMSEFYKRFLDENWKIHMDYNFQWYKKNFTLLFLALRVSIEKNVGKIFRNEYYLDLIHLYSI
ncbi:hypothetical protein WA026_008611 [Henosepilachna vigintioctopunctata]|uniref:Apoptogenic protein 1, mitochondrial n=1 Tax=Henosepilachna vigintioctopunctata TaxID=420089 RepID=A0AAW1UK27_9CUCU